MILKFIYCGNIFTAVDSSTQEGQTHFRNDEFIEQRLLGQWLMMS